jgi:uncharacterized repeat protein (TIGR01451 family)
MSYERDADPPAGDLDGLNNILAGGDNANNDHFDDGWRNRNAAFPNCRETTLLVRVRKPAVATLGQMTLNVWFDGNRDGDWEDVGECQGIEFPDGVGRSHEWIVQNLAVNLAAIPVGGYVDLPITTVLIHNTDGAASARHWVRFSLTERSAVNNPSLGRADGRGPDFPASFDFGETEDYFAPRTPQEQQGEPGELVLEKSVLSGNSPIKPGDIMTYVVTLEHVGGTALATAILSDTLPLGVVPAGAILVKEEAPIVAPLAVRTEERRVLWHGSLSPGGKIRFELPVRVARCLGQDVTITNTAGVRVADGSWRYASASVAVDCADAPQGGVQKRIVVLRDGVEQEVLAGEILPGGEARYRFVLSNPNERHLLVDLRDRLPEGLILLGESGPVHQFSRIVKLAPNEVKQFDVRVKLVELPAGSPGGEGAGLPGEQLVNVGRYITCLVDAEPSGAELLCAWPEENSPTIQQTNPVTLTVRGQDLGDAPDATNHSGASMTAYPGVPATYPTSADPALGMQGPRHAHPRPFHLGALVSIETMAEWGPDADGVNNLQPAANQPNLDRFDDGLRLEGLKGEHCRAVTFPVAVFIDGAALAALEQGLGYLNVWVDGTRDGDWADVAQCEGATGEAPGLAFEHFVIDFPINAAALGPGLHIVSVTSNQKVLWPAELVDRPAWLRVTLADRPSNKTLNAGGVDYGDGRGDGEPFRLGETEDYIFLGKGEQRLPDLEIRKKGIALPVETDGGVAFERIVWAIEYRNLGGAPATGVVITDQLEFAGDAGALIVESEPAISYTVTGSQLVFAVGAVAPSEGGFITVKTGVGSSYLYTNSVVIRSTEPDLRPDNNVDRARAELGLRAPFLAGPGNGTTCDDQVTAFGRSAPGSTVDLYVDGALTAAPVAGADGRWSVDLVLADGAHTLYAIARFGGLVSTPSPTMTVIVDSTLAWSPLSLRFIDPLGNSHRPVDETGRTDATGWQIRLHPGETYTVSVRICCDAGTAAVALVISSTLAVEMTDREGDALYEGVFTAPAAQRTGGSFVLSVSCGGVTTTGGGEVLIDPYGVVYHVGTAAALPDATVVCMEAQATSSAGGAATVFDLWPAADYDQINPQLTAADGYFSYFTPAGTYRLAVSRAGYQDYRSTDIEVISEIVRYDVPLTPKIDEAVDHVIIVAENGFEPAYLVAQPGDVVQFVNMDTDGHTATAAKAETAAAAVGGIYFDSGLLLAGEKYTFQLTAAGSYRFVDNASPANRGTLVVSAAPAAAAFAVYLPITGR